MEMISDIVPYISPSALPLLLVVLFYIKIKNDRKKTGENRVKSSCLGTLK